MFPRVVRRLGILAIVIVTLGCTAAAGSSADPRPTETSSAKPTPSATLPSNPSPSPSTRPPLRYPESQSYGVVTVSFVSPALDTLAFDIACEWSSPTEVGYWMFPGRVDIAGEAVAFELSPKSTVVESLLYIGRIGAAAYQAGDDTGWVGLTEHADDWSSGQVTFKELAPNAETAPTGPMPSPLEDWIRPLGGDPDNALLSGMATWACEPAPATVPTPEPIVSEEPERTPPPVPEVVLVSGDQRDAGDPLCGSFDIDGYTASDGCGIGFLWVGPEHTIRVSAGDRLRFEAPKGWHFEGWTIGWASQAEAERFRFERPDSFIAADEGTTADGRVLEVDAPPVGEWDVELSWSIARGGDEAQFPSYYRVLVED
jgi:hypothetical protein